MIPLTNLDEKDELPCPLMTAPEIIGQCKWLNGSTLEFIPDEPLLNANRYQLSVVPTRGLIYELQDTFTGEILTPPLHLTIGSSFDPQKGIMLYSNTPITTDELQKYLTLYVPMKSEETGTPVEVVKPVSITPYTDNA